MVRKDGQRVWIEAAKAVFLQHFDEQKAGGATPWAERSDTYMYLAQMRLAGAAIDYADLITIAGYGPSFAYAPGPADRWNAHYFPVSGRDDRIAHATGYQYRWQQYEDPEHYWQALKRAVDSGNAVHGPNEEDVPFVGYEEAENPQDRKVMPVAIVFVDDDEWTWAQFVMWHSREMVNGWFGALHQQTAPWPATESAVEVIETMVRVANGDDPRRTDADGVVWGTEGIAAYARDLADVSKSGATQEMGGYFQGGWRGCHNVMPQMSGRPAAAAYLTRVALLFDEVTRAHIESAAAAYTRATESWRIFDGQLGRALPQTQHEATWQHARHRLAGADAVRQAADHEADAITALEQALAAFRASPIQVSAALH